MAINILSKSTWRKDFLENLEFVRMLKIPIYIVFTPFDVATRPYKAPFLRVYQLQPDGTYSFKDSRKVVSLQGESNDFNDFIDLEDSFPFVVGLIRLEKLHENSKPLFRLIFKIKPDGRIIQNTIEKAESRATQAESRATQSELKAEKYQASLKKHGINEESSFT